MRLHANISVVLQCILLVFIYTFLYIPIFYVIYTSFVSNYVFPFPPKFTLSSYGSLLEARTYGEALINSIVLGLSTGGMATIFATLGGIGILRYQSRWRLGLAVIYLSPLFVANILLAISILLASGWALNIPGSIGLAIVANVIHALSFAFLIILSQFVRYDWRLDEAAMVFGATPVRCFFRVTLPVIWPAILGAFLVSFILAFNDLELSFYTLGAVPTIPTATWGALRFKFAPELFALAALINAFVFVVFAALFFLLRTGILRLGPPEK